jgi:hypothetical protein
VLDDPAFERSAIDLNRPVADGAAGVDDAPWRRGLVLAVLPVMLASVTG